MLTKEASEIIQKEMTVKQAKGIYKRERLAEKTISDLRYIEVLSLCPDLIDNDWLWQDREARRHAAATGGGPARKFAEMDVDKIPVLDRPTSSGVNIKPKKNLGRPHKISILDLDAPMFLEPARLNKFLT